MQEFKQYDLIIPRGLKPCDSVTPSTVVSELEELPPIFCLLITQPR